MRYLQDNLRRQYELAKKWNIDMPLVSGLKLEYFSKSITLDQSKLPDFLYDLGIPSRAVKLPMAKEVEIDEHQEFSKNDEKILEKNLLNEKIELLHKCLTPSDIPAELPECLSKYTDAFTTFKESVQGCMDGLGDQYIKALSTFRDIILEQ